jgi:hypothetical protein
MLWAAALLLNLAAPAATEADVRALLRTKTGVVALPPGAIDISAEIVLPEGARDLIISGAPEGTLLRAAAGFRGRALLVARKASGVRFRSFGIDGNRAALEVRGGLPPYDTPFARFTPNNGLLIEDSEDVAVERVGLRNVAGFAVLVARSSRIQIRGVRISDSGSRNAKGRNNSTGGILLEGGVAGFSVGECVIERVRGNGVWTHSLYTSPRNRDGSIARNRFFEIGRDAIQVGHAIGVRVENNTGTRIGFPVDEVDVEGGGTPVAIDTAGNVERSVYARNRFQEINGKCIDLDGFHHGEVRENTCVNRGRAEDYPFGHYGIVMNNTNPDMQSERIAILGNVVRGMKFGGIFVIGTDHRIENNRLLELNTAGCNESSARFGCSHFPGEPDLLQAGIYLGRRAERPAIARRNLIRGNTITGHKMAARCIAAAPDVLLEDNTIDSNLCRDAP